jgi:hypothetical protein
LLAYFCGWLYSWFWDMSYFVKSNNTLMIEKILNFIIKILMLGGILSLLLGLSLVIELAFIR